MSDTSTDFYTRQAAEARGPESQDPPKRKQKKRLKKILIASGVSIVLVVAAVGGGGYMYANSMLNRIHRIPGIVALTAAHQPFEAPGSMNVLLTDSQVIPGEDTQTGLIELMHLNATGQGGAVISFPANTEVRVPGHGRTELGNTLALGGPSLMIETLERLTDVRINHYSVIDFSGLAQVIGAIGGVSVTVPYAFTSFGFHFRRGVDRITAANALAYVRQIAVSEVGRMELQENLFRAVLHKIANHHLFLHMSVVDAVVKAVSVDSNLSNSRLVSLAKRLADLQSSDGVSIDVPTTGSPGRGGMNPVFLRNRLSHQLWRAINHDAVAQFAQRYPFTVTPSDPI